MHVATCTQYLKTWIDYQTSGYQFKLAKLVVRLAGLLYILYLPESTFQLLIIFIN